jgi:hypothetical protein
MPDIKPEQMLETDLAKDRQYLERRISEMEREYSSFRDHYKDLSEHVSPRRGRFFVEDNNKGDKRHKNIINNKGTMALRAATAGMFAGVASPSRAWFKWSTLDYQLRQREEVKVWLEDFQRLILMVFAKSNFYNMAPMLLRELLLFGTGAMIHVDDYEDVARFYTLTAGSYMISQNHRQEIDTLVRTFQMTCQQMIAKFGYGAVSDAVRTQYDRGSRNSWHTVVQFIEPNPFVDASSILAVHKPYRSVWFEKKTKSASDNKLFLRRSGFNSFPAYVPRWEVASDDIYAVNCPGMTTLGDVKMLQVQEKEKEKAIAKASTPPLQGPPSLRNQPIPNLPGGVTINSAVGSGQKLEAIYNVDPRVQELVYNIQATERRIDAGYFVDMFLAITNQPGIQPKNELQLSQINEERLLQLGPVLEQVHGEWLARAVSRVAEQVLAAELMPPAPEALRGHELELEFISSLAMAQRSVSISGYERTLGFAGALQGAGINVADKIDGDRALEDYADLVGGPARMIVPDEVVQQRREVAAQKQQRMEQMAMAQSAASMAKDVGGLNIDGGTVAAAVTGGNR